MNFTLLGFLVTAALLVGILLAIGIGRRIGLRRFREEGEDMSKGFGAVVGAIFGLMGLVLAFTFSGALTRFDDRRHLVVEEANHIGTAWLRIELLSADAQPAMRELFRRYLDSRFAVYQNMADRAATEAALARSAAVQGEIWELAVKSSQQSGSNAAPMLLLPALNAMFDITTTRAAALRLHPPTTIYGMLGVLALACSLFAGYEMGGRPRLNWLHASAYALVLTVTVYVILDIEYPRLGLIQMGDSDQVLIDLRRAMD